MLKVFKALQAMLLQQSQANKGLLKSLDQGELVGVTKSDAATKAIKTQTLELLKIVK
jgi:hypothetical protein